MIRPDTLLTDRERRRAGLNTASTAVFLLCVVLVCFERFIPGIFGHPLFDHPTIRIAAFTCVFGAYVIGAVFGPTLCLSASDAESFGHGVKAALLITFFSIIAPLVYELLVGAIQSDFYGFKRFAALVLAIAIGSAILTLPLTAPFFALSAFSIRRGRVVSAAAAIVSALSMAAIWLLTATPGH
ncbi:MAG: hypothetical protein U0136_14465 [Bdellovibrionota bacterium]